MEHSKTNDTGDFSRLPEEMYKVWEQGMTNWWEQVLDSNVFLKAMGDNLSTQSHARAQYERSVDDTLTRLHLPSRADVLRLARIASMLEERLLRHEDLLLSVQDRSANQEKESIQARIASAEARLESRGQLEQLDHEVKQINEQLSTITGAVSALQQTLGTVQEQVNALDSALTTVQQKLDTLEARVPEKKTRTRRASTKPTATKTKTTES